jgi:hypothetical protein
MSNHPTPGRRPRIALAAIACSAAAAVVLTGLLIALIGWLQSSPTASTEGGLTAVSILVAGATVTVWIAAEAVGTWLVSVHLARRFPRGITDSVVVHCVVIVLHVGYAMDRGTDGSIQGLVLLLGVVPFSLATVILLAIASWRARRHGTAVG